MIRVQGMDRSARPRDLPRRRRRWTEPGCRVPVARVLMGALFILSVSGCRELLVEPAPQVASLSVSFAIPPSAASPATDGIAADAATAFGKLDGVNVRLTKEGVPVVELSDGFDPGSEVVRVQVEVPLDRSFERFELEVILSHQGQPVFKAAGPIELAWGTTTETEAILSPVPAAVTVQGGPVTFAALHSETQLFGAVVFATGDPVPGLEVTWATQNPQVVEITPQGMVRAMGAGEAQVMASYGAFTGFISVEVRQVVASVVLAPGEATIMVGESVGLGFELYDSNGFAILGQPGALGWSSSAPETATVDSNGLVTGITEGTTQITGSIDGKAGHAQVTVLPLPDGSVAGEVVVEGGTESIAGAIVEFIPGGSTTTGPDGRFAMVLPPRSYYATISAEGFESAAIEGIVVSPSAATDVGTIALRPMVDAVIVAPASALLAPEETIQFEAQLFRAGGIPIDGEGRSVAWSSSDPLVAAVDGNGMVVGGEPGEATITATSEGVSGQSTVIVEEPGPVIVEFADPALEAAVRSAIEKAEGDLTSEDLEGLLSLSAFFEGIEDLSGLEFAVNLVSLEIYGNPLSDLGPLAGLTMLEYLELGENEIVDLSPLAGLTNVTQLSLSFNEITNLGPLAGLTSLLETWLDGNFISDVSPLGNLTDLTYIRLDGNAIESIAPLADLTALVYLDVSNNTIVSVGALEGMPELLYIGLDDNLVEDLAPLAENLGLGGGTFLEVVGNPLSQDALCLQIPDLIDRGVSVTFSGTCES